MSITFAKEDMMRLPIIAVLIICLPLSAAMVMPRDYYVDCATGDDANSGISWEEAWQSLEHAVATAEGNQADPGVIHIAQGRYGDPYWSPGGYDYETLYVPPWIWLKGEGSQRTYLAYDVLFTLGCETVIEDLSAATLGGVEGQFEDTSVTLANCKLTSFSLYAGEAHFAGKCIRASVVISECSFMDCEHGTAINLSGEKACYDVTIRSTYFSRINSSEGYPPTAHDSRWLVLGDLRRPSVTRQVDHLVMQDCIFFRTGFCTEAVYLWLMAGLNWRCDAQFSNCLFAFTEGFRDPYGQGPPSPERCLWVETAANGECDVSFANCTLVGDVAVKSSGVGGQSQHVSFLDSIVWTDQHNIAVTAPPEIDTDYSCVSWPAEGQGVIHSDPLFATGALGEEYLSQGDCNQPTTSPCVDAGSMVACNSTVACLTTRTDHEPDLGVLDMGFHYGRKIGPDPDIVFGPRHTCRKDAAVSAGDEMTIGITLYCRGIVMLADAYLAAAYGDQMFYLSDDGWTQNQLPWMRLVPVNHETFAQYYSFPLRIPESAPLGTYKLYLGLVDHYSGELVSLASTDLVVVAEPSF